MYTGAITCGFTSSQYYADCYVETQHLYECRHQTNQLNKLFARPDCAESFTVNELGCAFLGPDHGAALRYSLADQTRSLEACRAVTVPGLSAALREVTDFGGGRYNGTFFELGCRRDLAGFVHVMLAVGQAEDTMATGESRVQLLTEALNELVAR